MKTPTYSQTAWHLTHRATAELDAGTRRGWPGLPWLGLALLGGLLVFAPMLEGGTTHLAVMVIRLILLLALGVAVAVALSTGSASVPRLGVGAAVGCFLAVAVVATLRSPYLHQSLQWLIVLVSYALLLYLLAFFVSRWNHLWGLVAVVVAVGLLEAGSALGQAVWLGAVRPTGTFFNPNFLAGYLGAVALVVVGLLCYAKPPWLAAGRRRAGWLTGGAGCVVLGLLLAGMIVSGSRGAAVATSVGAACLLWIRFGARGVAGLGLLLGAALLVPNPIVTRAQVEQSVNPVTYARLQMWQQALTASTEHPFGVGLGLYRYISPRYAVETAGGIARYGKIARTPHNEYLQIAVEAGAVALAIFWCGLVLLARETAAALRGRLSRRQRGVVVGLAGGVVALLVHAALDSSLHEPALAILLTLYVGLLLSVRRLGGRPVARPREIALRPRWVWAGVALVALPLLAWGVLRMGLAWEAYEQGSRAHARQDQPAALAGFRKAVALDPGKALYHSALGAVHFGRFDRQRGPADAQAAVEHMRVAVSLNPVDGRLFGVLGFLYRSLERALPPGRQAEREAFLRAAALAYQRAVELEPYAPFHRLALGAVYLELGNGPEAEATVRQAVVMEPNFLPGRAWLARLYVNRGETTRGREELREIMQRRARYANRPKDAYETRFLDLDTTSLAEALG